MFYTVVTSEIDMSDLTCSPSQNQWTDYFQSLDDAHAFIKLMDNEPPCDDVITEYSLGDTVDVIPTWDQYRYPEWSPVRYIEFITP